MISKIYSSFEKKVPQEIKNALARRIDTALETRETIPVFFRADDIGVPSHNFSRMMALFLQYRIPLCLAVVPSWITLPRWVTIQTIANPANPLFCWHMHGYRHQNYETHGKKQEFGPARSEAALYNDLSNGWKRLYAIMGETVTPVFTPPWNRCSLEAMQVLKKIGFASVSRSHGSLPLPPPGMVDFQVHVDLHTRKESHAKTGWESLLDEFSLGLASGVCGIMIHHMRMNEPAFVFLEFLLKWFSECDHVRIITYNEMI